jgi:hypothetical protein
MLAVWVDATLADFRIRCASVLACMYCTVRIAYFVVQLTGCTASPPLTEPSDQFEMVTFASTWLHHIVWYLFVIFCVINFCSKQLIEHMSFFGYTRHITEPLQCIRISCICVSACTFVRQHAQSV